MMNELKTIYKSKSRKWNNRSSLGMEFTWFPFSEKKKANHACDVVGSARHNREQIQVMQPIDWFINNVPYFLKNLTFNNVYTTTQTFFL